MTKELNIQPIPTLEVINKYKNGESVLSLSKTYKTYTGKIQSILDKNDIEKITQAKRNNPLLIEDYFKCIDTKEKAYWLGWLLTDGGISPDGDIEISLSNKDEYILKLFEKDLGISNHVKPFGQKYCRFYLGSKAMCNDLLQYGIVPNKTLELKYPSNIPEKYETHLLRGMFDGDGGLTIGFATRFYKHRNKSYTKPYRELSFTGTYDMCENFQKVLLKYTDFSIKNIGANHNIYRVRWSSKEDIVNVMSVLYKDCEDHYLKRKYDLYLQLKNGDEK